MGIYITQHLSINNGDFISPAGFPWGAIGGSLSILRREKREFYILRPKSFHFPVQEGRLNFPFYNSKIACFTFYKQFSAFFHFTIPCSHLFCFTGLPIFPFYSHKFGLFPFYSFKKVPFPLHGFIINEFCEINPHNQ